jgi:NADPH2:quinone reductase
MRAIQIFQPGGPEVLTEVEIPTPEAGPAELRVKAEVLGIGRPDVLVRKGTYKWMPPLPAIPGSELVGIVDQVGAGGPDELLGRRVLVSARELPVRGGCYAEYICVPATAVYVLPDSIDAVDAASLPNLQLVNALWTCTGDRPIRTLLVTGISGGVGSMLTQFAHMKGVRVLGTTSSPEKARFVMSQGVSCVVQGDPGTWVDQVMQATQGQGVDVAIDQLGGDALIACLRSLAPMGAVLSINVIKGMPTQDVFKEMRTLLARSLSLRTFSMHTFDEDIRIRRGLMHQAIEQMASGQVKAPPSQVLDLSQIQHAHSLLDAGASRGKLVVKI